jgi:hypothetical protein
MHRIWVIILFVFVVFSNIALASETNCARLVSQAWVGSFMIKTFPACGEYKTCFHSAVMTIASTGPNDYTLTLTPLDKASESLKRTKHFICVNDVAKVTDNQTANVSYTCEYTKCMLKYEDNQLVAAMLEVLG